MTSLCFVRVNNQTTQNIVKYKQNSKNVKSVKFGKGLFKQIISNKKYKAEVILLFISMKHLT